MNKIKYVSKILTNKRGNVYNIDIKEGGIDRWLI